MWKKLPWSTTRKKNSKKRRNILKHLENSLRLPFVTFKAPKAEKNCQNFEEVMRRIKNKKNSRIEIVNEHFKSLQ